jgi:hypothetical protein
MTSLRWPSSADLDALIVSSKSVFSWLSLFQCLFNSIEHGIRLRTSGSPVAVAANALADALVVTEFPSSKTEAVINLMHGTKDGRRQLVYRHLEACFLDR